ncbi:hypothetical protein HY605_02105, partial [Candidatus Peregrinibacteria bacterium]|nr:hypothetical protein [Candidatus Peregrinibacteria bacterium]
METIEITDGVVHLVEKRVIRSVYVKSFKEAIVATIGFRSPILPSNTILYAQKSSSSAYVLESPPSMRTIKHRGESNRIKEYTIAIPYAYFIPVFKAYALEELYLFFSPKKVEKMDDVLYKP